MKKHPFRFAFTVAIVAWSSIVVSPAAGRTRLQSAGVPVPRGTGRLVYDGDRQLVVLLDTIADPDAAGDARSLRAWSWSGRGWEVLSESGPVWRAANAAVYDSRRGRVVMFGGAAGPPAAASLGDTWELDGRSWIARGGSNVPGRDHHALVYDASRARTVMFGGGTFERGKPYQWREDTWEWDGVAWRQVATAGPGARRLPGMVYDRRRKQVVLFGGIDRPTAADLDPGTLGHTWAWTGTRWRRISESGPSPRYGHAMGFDTRAGVTLLYGGNDLADQPLADMWQWDGRRWTEIALTGGSPGTRFGAAMVHDEARGRTVLFGGRQGDSSVWEWDGTRWNEIPAVTRRGRSRIRKVRGALAVPTARVLTRSGAGPTSS